MISVLFPAWRAGIPTFSVMLALPVFWGGMLLPLIAHFLRFFVEHERVWAPNTLPIPSDLIRGNREEDAEFRARVQAWVNGIGSRKDAQLERMPGGTDRAPIGTARPT